MRAKLVAASVAFALAAPFAAGEDCFTLEGRFVATAEIPCLASPVLLCTHGTLTGDLDGAYEFVMTSNTLGSDPSRPLLMAFTGASEILLADGSMQAEDYGTMEANPVGPWPFETHVVIHSGTGAWSGAVGELVAVGALDTSAGVTEGTYAGHVCV